MVQRRNGTLLGLALLLLSQICAPPAAAQEARPVGHIVQQRGPVTALAGGTPRMLFLGARVFQGDMIVTGANSRIRVEFADGSALSLGAEAQVEIDRMVLGPNGQGVKGVISLVIGILRASLAGAPWADGFEIETRAAVASVRATDFIAEAQADKTSVFVVEGRVAVTPAVGEAVTLDAGFGVDVTPGGGADAVKKWGAKRVEDAIARTRVP